MPAETTTTQLPCTTTQIPTTCVQPTSTSQVDTEKIMALIEAVKSEILTKVTEKCQPPVKNFIVNENYRQMRKITEKLFSEIGEKVENVCKGKTNVFA
jgi:hypothetical protein